MKTLAIAAAATFVATTSFAGSFDEPVCHPASLVVAAEDWPGYSSEMGVWYDRGDYFFMAENDNGSPVRSEYTTTHHRLFKDGCKLVSVDIFHKNDDDTVDPVIVPVVVAPPVVEDPCQGRDYGYGMEGYDPCMCEFT